MRVCMSYRLVGKQPRTTLSRPRQLLPFLPLSTAGQAPTPARSHPCSRVPSSGGSLPCPFRALHPARACRTRQRPTHVNALLQPSMRGRGTAQRVAHRRETFGAWCAPGFMCLPCCLCAEKTESNSRTTLSPSPRHAPFFMSRSASTCLGSKCSGSMGLRAGGTGGSARGRAGAHRAARAVHGAPAPWACRSTSRTSAEICWRTLVLASAAPLRPSCTRPDPATATRTTAQATAAPSVSHRWAPRHEAIAGRPNALPRHSRGV